MAAGAAFDPEEYARFKSGLSGQGSRDAAPAVPAAPVADAFDANEFAQFKAQRQGGGQQRPPRTRANPFDSVAEAPSFEDHFSGPMASAADTSSPLGAGMRAKADEALVGPPSARNAAEAGLYRFANAMALNLPRNATAAVESLRTGRSFDDSYRDVREVEDALARQSPKSALAGTVSGIGAGMVTLPAIPAAQGANIVGRGIANALTGAGYGFAGELADTKDLGRAGVAAAAGGILGGVGGAIIEKAAPVFTRLFARNAPFRNADGSLTDQAAGALREVGVDPAAVTPQLAQHLETVFSAKGPSVAAAREALAVEQGITLSRGQATADPQALAMEGRALAGRSGERAQGVAREFADQQAGELAAVGDRLQGMAAGTFDRVASPTAAFEAAADRARLAAAGQAEQASIAQRGVDDALRSVRGRGETDALDGAAAAAQGVRDAADQAKAGYRDAYADVAQIPGQFAPGAMDRVGSRVRGRLGPEYALDDVLTPQAVRALSDLDNVPGLFNLQPGEGPTLQQIDQLRKRLVSRYPSTAQSPTDRRALGRVIEGLDQHVEDAVGAGLFGSRQAAGPRDLAQDGFPGMAATPPLLPRSRPLAALLRERPSPRA